jgi:hypothetical protein
MSWAPEVNFVQNYRAQLEHAFQQEGSRLRRTVTVGTQKAKSDFHDRLEALGNTSAHAMTTRHGDTPVDDITHGRRRVTMVGYNHNLMFDNQDKLRMLVDPTSDYAKSQAFLLGRKVDLLVLDAASGTAYTGETGATSQSFDSGQRVAVDYVEGGGAATTSNLTIGKLRRACFLLDENEVMGKRYFIGSASQKQSLLRSTEVTSSDYNSVKALVNGEVNTFMGFEFVWTQLCTLTSATNVRTCLAYVPQAIRLNFGEELKLRITERADKNYSIQVYSELTAGATRMWEEAIVEVACDEDF